MKKYFTLILLLLAFTANAQWYLQQITPSVTLYDISFVNKYTGWACGENLIFKTTNSGTNWILQPNPAQSYIFQIHPVNDSVVYAAGWCTILKTTDGGNNWIPIRLGTPQIGCTGQAYQGLWFKDENTGWFCGRQIVIRTTDGGNAFIDSAGVTSELFDLYFDDSIGVASSSNYNFFRTTNFGTNWYAVPLPNNGTTSNCYRLTFKRNLGWTVNVGGNIVYHTNNLGTSWDSIYQIQGGPNFNSYSIEFSSELTGYAGGTRGKIYKTTDGGFSWRLQASEQFGDSRYGSIYALNDSIVWAAGTIGKILYTTTGGSFLVSNIEPSLILPDDFKLYQNYPNPFNPSTKIKYEAKNYSKIKIEISDLSGKEIAVLTDKEYQPGIYEIIFDATNLASGIYFYQMFVDGKLLHSKRMVFLK